MIRESKDGTLARRRRTVANGAFGVVEYVSQPLGLLLAAPYLLHHMGPSQFGVWILACATVNGGSLLSGGFGDAAIRYVAMYRGQGDFIRLGRVVRSMILINLTLGILIALGSWTLAPYVTRHVPYLDGAMRMGCQRSVRIGSLLLIVRSVDSVFASTLRAFERYGATVRISVCSRLATLAAAVVLVASGRGVLWVMVATLYIAFLSAFVQAYTLRRNVNNLILLPEWDRETLHAIAGFGSLSWLQALSAVIFGQADRLLIGVVLGAPAVAVYALCDQAAQCVHGVISAGFHILFAHLSVRLETESVAETSPALWTALRWNLALAIMLGLPVVVFSRPILTLWMGRAFAQQAWPVLSILAAGSAMLAMNVTAHYALLATGAIRVVTIANLAAGSAMLLTMVALTPHFGVLGTAFGWLLPGPITCLLYLPLVRVFRATPSRALAPATLSSQGGQA